MFQVKFLQKFQLSSFQFRAQSFQASLKPSFQSHSKFLSSSQILKPSFSFTKLRNISNETSELETNYPLLCSKIEDTMELGAIIGEHSNAGDVILLEGDLASGKTCFAKGFILEKTKDIHSNITSPTFIIENIYKLNASTNIYHIDLYRISKEDELKNLNLPEKFCSEITLIEWPQNLFSYRPKTDYLLVQFQNLKKKRKQSKFQNKFEEEEEDFQNQPKLITLKPEGKWKSKMKSIINQNLSFFNSKEFH